MLQSSGAKVLSHTGERVQGCGSHASLFGLVCNTSLHITYFSLFLAFHDGYIFTVLKHILVSLLSLSLASEPVLSQPRSILKRVGGKKDKRAWFCFKDETKSPEISCGNTQIWELSALLCSHLASLAL